MMTLLKKCPLWKVLLAVWALPIWAFSGCDRNAAEPTVLTVAAAASLKDALPPLARQFEAAHPNTRVRLSFGSSGTLQSQIENGAPIDVFVAASSHNMDALEQANLLASGWRAELARGQLVLIAPAGSTLQSLSELASPRIRRVAIGAPSVPAGDYARQALAFLKLERSVQSKRILGKDVRAVLALVRSGEADAGFVYRSDALTAPEVRVVARVPSGAHEPIVYPIAIVANSTNLDAARAFVVAMTSEKARSELRARGF